MSNIIDFPGQRENENLSVEEVFKKTLEAQKLKYVVVVGILEGDAEVMITGNTSLAHGVYLMEVGKTILINQ
ncbi:MAG: hypothetical protein ACREAE_03625 [Nitrosopumilaceae archaeon]